VKERVLITGGAGFIGCALAQELLQGGHEVRVLDAIVPQVHGGAHRPARLPDEVELMVGDVRDPASVRRALDDVDVIVHLAASVGVGQSMYQIAEYTEVNDLGTAVLLEQLAKRPVRRIVTASSMSVYGEGLYQDADGRLHETVPSRRAEGAGWEFRDAQGRPLMPLPTPETKRPALASVYAIGKYVQESMTLTVAGAYGIDAVALRLWNVFGPGQALGNPYTGVLAIFASRLANGESPLIFEDGAQLRDFVHVRDVARAFAAALVNEEAEGEIINIASGTPRSVHEVAMALAAAMGIDRAPQITGERRSGDVRHCIADIGKARRLLGYQPVEDFRAGLAELAQWVARQQCVDRTGQAHDELVVRGLVA